MENNRGVSIVKLPCFEEVDGNLISIENDTVPFFNIERIFYIYNVPLNKSRADHASKNTDFLMIPISGKLNICIDDGIKRKKYVMSNKRKGLYVPNNHWIKISSFSNDAVLLVLANTKYKDSIYYNDYNDFLNSKMKG